MQSCLPIVKVLTLLLLRDGNPFFKFMCIKNYKIISHVQKSSHAQQNCFVKKKVKLGKTQFFDHNTTLKRLCNSRKIMKNRYGTHSFMIYTVLDFRMKFILEFPHQVMNFLIILLPSNIKCEKKSLHMVVIFNCLQSC